MEKTHLAATAGGNSAAVAPEDCAADETATAPSSPAAVRPHSSNRLNLSNSIADIDHEDDEEDDDDDEMDLDEHLYQAACNPMQHEHSDLSRRHQPQQHKDDPNHHYHHAASTTTTRTRPHHHHVGDGDDDENYEVLIPNITAFLDHRKRPRRKSAVITTPDPIIDLPNAASSHSGGSHHSSRRHHHHRYLPPQLATHGHDDLATPNWPVHDRPDFAHLAKLLWTLLLSTTLALVAAFDAQRECLQQETYSLLDLVDDDNFQKAYAQVVQQNYNEAGEITFSIKMPTKTCWSMFWYVVVPTAAVTLSGALLGWLLIRRFVRQYPHKSAAPARCVRLLTQLLVLTMILGAAQTYHMTQIMLQPRKLDDDDDDDGSDDDNDASANPFTSLAAVDSYGHVGDNANLYYMAWLSQALALVLCYQTASALWRTYKQSQLEKSNGVLLPSTSWHILLDHDHSMRSESYRSKWGRQWYKSLYRLRIRTGTWTAALLLCWLITASSQYVWSQVLWPYVATGNNGSNVIQDNDVSYLLNSRHVCQVISEASGLPAQLCRRTLSAWLSGLAGMLLCSTAIGMHWAARLVIHHEDDEELLQHDNVAAGHHSRSSTTLLHPAPFIIERLIQKRLPLRTELVLSVLLSGLLGFNAVFCTGVQGPAATVGNLYYASWLSFLLCVRISLGCVEEYHHLNDNEEHESTTTNNNNAGSTTTHLSKSLSSDGGYKAPKLARIEPPLDHAGPITTAPVPALTSNHNGSNLVHHQQSILSNTSSRPITSTNSTMDTQEKDRVARMRRYFFLTIFSMVCAASAYDAACNQKKALNQVQRYMIYSPCGVAALSALLFCLCLSPACYVRVSQFGVGGVLSIISFGLWLGDLFSTMHSDTSWAVNGFGEIQNANLYYFSWAAILTAGLQMMSYVMAALGIKTKDTTSVLWAAICKVCFVMLGAGLHIWHTISDHCDIDEITNGAVTFCSRTILAMVVALTGMLVGGLVVGGRLLMHWCCRQRGGCVQIQAHVEMIVSIFLLFLFGATVALITGIGGPGQTVGDLYYSCWLAFSVSLGVAVSCYDQIRLEDEAQQQLQTLPQQDEPDAQAYHNKLTEGTLV